MEAPQVTILLLPLPSARASTASPSNQAATWQLPLEGRAARQTQRRANKRQQPVRLSPGQARERKPRVPHKLKDGVPTLPGKTRVCRGDNLPVVARRSRSRTTKSERPAPKGCVSAASARSQVTPMLHAPESDRRHRGSVSPARRQPLHRGRQGPSRWRAVAPRHNTCGGGPAGGERGDTGGLTL